MATTVNTRAKVGTRRRIDGFDMIRGGAVFLVLLRHAWPDVFGGAGIVGIVAFFALSGYLITGILVKEIDATGKVHLGRFYVHRFFRLIPPLVALILVYAIVELSTAVFGDKNILKSVVVGLTYTANIPFVHGSDSLSHLWTLATEEQFYLVWPLILVLAFRLKRLRLVVGTLLALSLLVCAASVVVAAPNIERIYTLPTSWASSMILGALASLWKVRLAKMIPGSRAGSTLIAGVAIGCLLVIAFLPDLKQTASTYLFIGPVVALLTIVLVFRSEQAGRAGLVGRPLVGLGRISYAAYLWNYPVTHFIGIAPLGLLAGLTSMLVTILIAILSWYLIEEPSQKLRRRTRFA